MMSPLPHESSTPNPSASLPPRVDPAQLSAILDTLPALIAYIDAERRYRVCNRAYADWLGAPVAAVIGRRMDELLAPADWAQVGPHVAAALAGTACEVEVEFQAASGKRWMGAALAPQRDAADVTGVVIHLSDITARKQAEDEMRENEGRFRAFVTTSSSIVYRMSADWTVMRQLVGRDFITDAPEARRGWLQQYIPTEDQPEVSAAIAAAIRTKSRFELEHRVLRVDGSIGWVHSRAIPLEDADGNIVEWFGSAEDVTDQREAERARQESEQRYRALFESIDEGFCEIEMIFDPTGRPVDYRFVEVNPAFENQAGMRQAAGRRMLEFVQHIEPHWLENYGRVALTGESIRFADEYKSLGAWFDVFAFRVGDPDRHRVAVLFNNITERKRAEDALRESEARFRAVISQATAGIAQANLQGRFLLVNQRFCDIVGYTEAELLQLRIHDLNHPEDLEENLQQLRAVAAGGPDFIIEKRYVRKDGATVWVHNNVAGVRDGDGTVQSTVAVVLDITERKQAEQALRESEERFRNMSNHSPMMLWVTDAGGHCVHLNQRWYEFTGQTAEQGLGFGWLDAVHPDDLADTEHRFHAANLRQEELRLEYRLRRHDGEYRWMLDTASARFSDHGDYLGHIGSVIDIQVRKEMEEVLREAKEAAEQASREKDKFLAQLSHELRTPLTPVLMAAATLREDETLPAPVREQLGMIERNVALEARLIDDLLDLTRITTGKLVLRSEPCDMHLLLQLVVEIVQDEVRERQLQLELELGARRSQVTGDSARLQQVLWNLLRNAVKFTPAGGRIVIRTADTGPAAPGEPPWFGLEVSDTGIGFEPELAESLFQPFERGPAADDQRYPGLGLGLAIARTIAERHGGRIRAESAGPGRGATFVVGLPGAVEATARRPTAGPTTPSTPEPALRLLLVEDHAPTLQVLARLLARSGHHVTPAATVAEATAAADRSTFDAVVSDLGLPDGTGLELMERLRDQHGLRGIALSGYGMDEDIRRSQAAGFVAHLTKPVNLGEVRRVLRQFFSPADPRRDPATNGG